jgi:hypothetical protein
VSRNDGAKGCGILMLATRKLSGCPLRVKVRPN